MFVRAFGAHTVLCLRRRVRKVVFEWQNVNKTAFFQTIKCEEKWNNYLIKREQLPGGRMGMGMDIHTKIFANNGKQNVDDGKKI